VLNVSKLSANLVTLTMTDFKPYEEISGVIRMFRDEVVARGIKLHFERDESWDRLKVQVVRGDSGRLTQVMVNLLRWAVFNCTSASSYTSEHFVAMPSSSLKLRHAMTFGFALERLPRQKALLRTKRLSVLHVL
jgi:hypothetical protein